MFLRRHFFSISITLLLVLAVSASFYRFYVLQDYLVKNEIECDPYTEQCYLWCEDDECTEPYYYAYTTRDARELHEVCGPNINECDEAWYCDPEEIACTVEFCDPELNECENLGPADKPLDELVEIEL